MINIRKIIIIYIKSILFSNFLYSSNYITKYYKSHNNIILHYRLS